MFSKIGKDSLKECPTWPLLLRRFTASSQRNPSSPALALLRG